MSGEKTEKATPKRQQEERKKGNILTSKDINTVVTLIGTFYVLEKVFSTIIGNVQTFIIYIFELILIYTEIKYTEVATTAHKMIYVAVSSLAPLFLTTMTLGVVATVAQTKPVIVWESLKPNFGKLNPISGFKNLFSLKSVLDVVKNLIKITILGAILYNYISSKIIVNRKFYGYELEQAISVALDNLIGLVFQVAIAFLAIAIADYYYQKWEYERKMKMSKQDIKDEYKKMEGDPKVKGKIKETQRRMAMSRMMQSVPDADVVIKNPTHFAVALKYDLSGSSGGAPIVIAKGQDELALRIIKIAEESEVAVVENVPLARALYATSDINREISPEFYGTVAEVLVYVYKLKNKKL